MTATACHTVGGQKLHKPQSVNCKLCPQPFDGESRPAGKWQSRAKCCFYMPTVIVICQQVEAMANCAGIYQARDIHQATGLSGRASAVPPGSKPVFEPWAIWDRCFTCHADPFVRAHAALIGDTQGSGECIQALCSCACSTHPRITAQLSSFRTLHKCYDMNDDVTPLVQRGLSTS